MIEAQLGALKEFTIDTGRRQYVENELSLDLEYINDTMNEGPNTLRHRERMASMHKDFFAILKWQRRRMQTMVDEEPERIVGDIEELKKYLADKASAEKLFNSKFGNKSDSDASTSSSSSSDAPAVCPVRTATAEEIAEKKQQGLIHKVYDKDTQI
eukprot:TRINITY_DN1429_c0_g1_i1.p1 TRINITY_DN1429_c0_g1~~TRINITY_DN1429_c0_g1_i1.p1  ORF type:complete len:156 (+),score=50.88 TRINITY_DN1429_c0_g1_i1:154-621(+)